MKKTLSVLLIATLLILTNCGRHKTDIIQINHYMGGIGLRLKYEIGNNNLLVRTDCDFEDCSEKVIYERKLSEKEAEQLIIKIKTLKPDTLKKEYINSHILDGLYTEIYFGKLIGTNQNKVVVQNVDLNFVDSLSSFIDNLILEKKYRFRTFGQE